MGSREFFGEAIDVVEVAVGFIFVLLVQLSIVEFLVVEFGGVLLFRVAGLTSRFGMLGIRNCVMSAHKNLEFLEQLAQRTILAPKKPVLDSAGLVGSAGMKPGLSRADLARECANGSEGSDAT